MPGFPSTLRLRMPPMIVECDRCQTRFRLPDGAVGAKGAKARCSRCGNVFIVQAPPPADTQATLPPPAGYSGLTGVTAVTPQVSAPSAPGAGSEFTTEGPPTSRTELPSFLTHATAAPAPSPPSPRPPPVGLGAFAPSSAGRAAPTPDSLPPPVPSREISTPEQALDQFFDIPPPLRAPGSGSGEVPSFAGPEFGRTAEVSKFSRASHVSFPPPAAHESFGPPPTGASSIPEVPGFEHVSELPAWGVQDKETVRMEPDMIPDLDSLPEAPEHAFEPSQRGLRDTAEGDPFELQSALEQSSKRSASFPPRAPAARPKSAGPTRRLEVGGLDFISSASKAPGSIPPEQKQLPAWAIEVGALLIAGLVATPFLLALEDPGSPLRPIVSFLSSTPGPIDASALDGVATDGVRVQSLMGKEKGVVVRGQVRNLGESPLSDVDVLVHALDGDRVIETQRTPLVDAVPPHQAADFAVVFPDSPTDYRPLRFRVEVGPRRTPSAASDEGKIP